MPRDNALLNAPRGGVAGGLTFTRGGRGHARFTVPDYGQERGSRVGYSSSIVGSRRGFSSTCDSFPHESDTLTHMSPYTSEPITSDITHDVPMSEPQADATGLPLGAEAGVPSPWAPPMMVGCIGCNVCA